MFDRLAQLARHSAVYGLGSVASKIVAILLLPIYVRYVEPSGYGIAEAVLTLDLFTVALVKLGLHNAMMRFYYDHEAPEDAARVVHTVLTMMLVTTAVGAVILIACDAQLAGFFLGDNGAYRFLWIAAFGMWCSTIQQTMMATFRLEKRPMPFGIFSLVNITMSALLTIVFVVFMDWGATGLLLGNFLGTFSTIPPIMIMQRRFVRLSKGSDVRPDLLRFGLPTTPMAIANQGLMLIDRTAVARMTSLTALGTYSIASRVAQVVLLAVIAVQLAWQPFAYSIKDDEEARRVYSKVMTWFVCAVGWIVVSVSLLADPVLRVATTSKYYDAIALVPILALSAGVYGMYFIAGIGASRVKKTGYHVFVAAGALTTSLAANLILVPRFGATGAAIAALCANSMLSLLMFIRSQHVFPVRYETGRLLLLGSLITGSCALAILLPQDVHATLVPRILIPVLYPLVVFMLVLTRAERHAFYERSLKRRGK